LNSPVRTSRVAISGPCGELEAAVVDSAANSRFVAVICHPHPLQQGTMDNKVVTTIARAAARLGGTSIRFNYRGVGASAGQYDGGVGELHDLFAVVDWSRRMHDPSLPLVLAGFSFGGAIAYRAAEESNASVLITISPAYARIPASARPPTCAWLLVQGGADDVIAPQEVLDWASAHAPAPQIHFMEDTGHFFHGKLPALGQHVAEFIATAASI
jgi:alpha/beta superfamily hydrolase